MKFVREDLDWIEEGKTNLDSNEIKHLYNSLWGTKPFIDPLNFGTADQEIQLKEVLHHITLTEVQQMLNRMKNKGAAGPDGILKKDVKRVELTEILRLLYNIIMIRAYQPTAWYVHRTTLIPKEGKNSDKASNYRPITLGSILASLYWGIITRKIIKAIEITPRQKGFVSEAGCFNNVRILSETMRQAKRKKGLVAVQIGVSKAFDTDPHDAIKAALRTKRLPNQVIRMVAESYVEVFTSIRNREDTIEIKLRRGVEQGDPMSPLLFNLIMEPMIKGLEALPGYRINNEIGLSVLAFADGIILTAATVAEARNLLTCGIIPK